MNCPPVFRIRLTFSKLNALKYTGSLDMHRIWERSFRRAKLPLAYSQGFHPQPRINQALPLPLGMTSRNDLVDFWLEEEMDLTAILKALKPGIPPGLELNAISTVDVHAPTLPTLVVAARYTVSLLDEVDEGNLSSRMASLLSQPTLNREKRGKNYDLRPLIEQLDLLQPFQPTRLLMQLAARENATGRPEEVLLAMNLDPYAASIERTGLMLKPS